MNRNSQTYLDSAEYYLNANGMGDNFAADGNDDIYSALGGDDNFAADGDSGIGALNTTVNTYTLVANNTTGGTLTATLFGPDKQLGLLASTNYGNTGINLYVQEIGTTVASYGQFLQNIVAQPKRVNTWRITATSTSSTNITTQLQSIFTLTKFEPNGVFASYPMNPYKFISGNQYNPNIIDIPVGFDMTSASYVTVQIQAYTALTMYLFVGAMVDTSNRLSGRPDFSYAPKPVPTLSSQKVIIANK